MQHLLLNKLTRPTDYLDILIIATYWPWLLDWPLMQQLLLNKVALPADYIDILIIGTY